MNTKNEQNKQVILAELAAHKLRKRAEELVARQRQVTLDEADAMPVVKMREALYELRLHQIELEMQNEELQRVQQELDIARRRYFELYDLAAVGYCTVSISGAILECNSTAVQLLGTDKDHLQRTMLCHRIHKDDKDEYYMFNKRLFGTGEQQERELRMVTADDNVIWIQLSATLAHGANGTPAAWIVICDITRRKLAEEELRVKAQTFADISLECFNQLSKHCRAYRWEVDAKGMFTYIDDTCKSILGYAACDIVNKKYFFDLHPENGREQFKQAVLRLFASKAHLRERQKMYQTINGHCLTLSTNACPIIDADGRLTGYRGMDINVTTHLSS